MRFTYSLLVRIFTAILAFLCGLEPVLASTVIVTNSPLGGTTVQSIVQSASQNVLEIIQEAGSGATQNAGITGNATTIVGNVMDILDEQEVEVSQDCGTATGVSLCIQTASPSIHTIAIQNVTATASNLLEIAQQAGEQSSQSATISGAALTDLTAVQNVTTDVIVNIFQDCTVETGTCVQRALPDVLTLARQVVSAAALNEISIDQEAGSGSQQDAAIEASAEVHVSAEQFVSPRIFLYLSQLCTLDVGLCIQKAMPLVQTVVEQVVNAQASNTIALSQSGGLVQNATASGATKTIGSATQNVFTEANIGVDQQCNVGQGLCLQMNAQGHPVFVFHDGEETTTGDFSGDVNDEILDQDYSRETVAQVAGGICGETHSCGMLDKLLFWLFGPEPAPIVASSRPDTQGDPQDAGHRGHRTNVLGASVEFLAAQMGDDVAPAAFGGGENPLTSKQRQLFCSMRKAIPEDSDPGVWSWTAQKISALTGFDASFAEEMLRDESVCPQVIAATIGTREQLLSQIKFMPADDSGPLSTSSLWNKCVRGLHITLQDIRESGNMTCAAFHTQDSWYHPDLGIFFTWNRFTKTLELPEGYLPSTVLPSL